MFHTVGQTDKQGFVAEMTGQALEHSAGNVRILFYYGRPPPNFSRSFLLIVVVRGDASGFLARHDQFDR